MPTAKTCELMKMGTEEWQATVIMVKPYTDKWDHKPSTDDVLETLADQIRAKQVDDHFQIKVAQVR